MPKNTIQDTKRWNLRLHNNFVEAIFSLSVDAKKLLLAILLHINDDGKKIKIYRKDIYDKIGIDLKELNSKHRESLIEELMTTIVTIRELNNKDNWIKIQLIGKTFYKDGCLETSIDKDLMPYILEARERLFTRFNIQNIKPLTSIHAIRIYLLAKQFNDTGWREIDIDELKKIMELENKYTRIFDFKKKVLEVAKKQINANTDINIDYELIKEGKKYTRIRFKIKKQSVLFDHERMELLLHKKYRGKTFVGSNGLFWTIEKLKLVDKENAEIEATDLEQVKSFKISLKKLEKLVK